jgi:DNA polymerase-3 subunit delta
MLGAVPASDEGAPPDVLGTVTLVSGAEELFAERAVTGVLAAAKARHGDSDVGEVNAGELAAADLAELTSPTLFATARAVVVRDLQDASDEASAALLSYAASPVDDVTLVLVHGGGQKGKALLDRLRKLGAVTEIRCEALRLWQLPGFVVDEVRRCGGRTDAAAASSLVDAVGTDLRTLAAAAAQLVADSGGEPITAEVVLRYFGGRAEVKGFSIADAVIGGRTVEALEQLRWALNNGVAPVLITSALAAGLRAVARFAYAPRGLREADLARAVGVPPWKLKAVRSQARGWTPEGLAAAIRAVARADADVKGGAGDTAYALERGVLAVADARMQPQAARRL